MKKISFVIILTGLMFFVACQQNGENKAKNSDSTSVATIDSNTTTPIVLVYNFYSTHRCPSCIAIENATIKTLDSLYAEQVKNGQIKRFSINIDDAANAKLCEKYQAFGSGIFVTQILNGKENTVDLTGDGFKFAMNKEEKFIEILKSKIDEFLKQ